MLCINVLGQNIDAVPYMHLVMFSDYKNWSFILIIWVINVYIKRPSGFGTPCFPTKDKIKNKKIRQFEAEILILIRE